MENKKYPQVIYLDQNIWIKLSGGKFHPEHNKNYSIIFQKLLDLVKIGRIIVPLTFTNIYETHKKYDPEKRRKLAHVQAELSQGFVFRSRKPILRFQIMEFLCSFFSIPQPKVQEFWFISNLFFESADEIDEIPVLQTLSERLLYKMQIHSADNLYLYIAEGSEETRKTAVEKYTSGSADIVEGLLRRWELVRNDTRDMQRRTFSAYLFMEHQNLILEICKQIGIDFDVLHDEMEEIAMPIINETPILNIERELILKLLIENSQATENYLRDIASFQIFLQYCDVVVAEKAFINRSKQAGFGRKYDIKLLTDINDIAIEDFE